MTARDPLVKQTNTLASAYGSGPRETYYRATLSWPPSGSRMNGDNCVMTVIVRGYVTDDISISALTYSASRWDEIGKLGLIPNPGTAHRSRIFKLMEESPLSAPIHLERVLELTEAILLAQFGERKEGADRVQVPVESERFLWVATSDSYPRTNKVVVDDETVVVQSHSGTGDNIAGRRYS